MPTDDNNRLEVLMRLCGIAWTNFDRRRSYEWKLGLAIWTALAAFIALALRGNITPPPKLYFCLAASLILGLQIFFLYCIKLANDVDKFKALKYEGWLHDATGKTVEDTRGKLLKFFKGWWSIITHIGLTLVLIFAAGFAIYGNMVKGDLQIAPAVKNQHYSLLNLMQPVSGTTGKDISEVVRNYATCAAIIIGGIWAYMTFVRKREKYPSAKVSHRILHRRIDDRKMLLKVAVVIQNVGDVIISLDRRLVRVQQMVPWSTKALALIDVEPGYTRNEHAEVEWPLLEEVDLSGEKPGQEIEPGESDELHFDFVIRSEVDTVVVYSYLKNVTKQNREIGWNTTSVYDIKNGKET